MIVIIIGISGITQDYCFHEYCEQAVIGPNSSKPHHTHHRTTLLVILLSLIHLVCSIVHRHHVEFEAHTAISECSFEVHGADATTPHSEYTSLMRYDGQKPVLSLTEQKHGNHPNVKLVGVGFVTLQFLLEVPLQIQIALHSQPVHETNHPTHTALFRIIFASVANRNVDKVSDAAI